MSKKQENPLQTTGRKDALTAAGRAAPACGSWRPQVWVNVPPALLPCPPEGRKSLPTPCRAHEVVRAHYPSTALQPFFYLSRKELTKPFDLLPKTKKQIKC